MRTLVEQDFVDSIAHMELDAENVRFAMDFDLGIIEADKVRLNQVLDETFLADLAKELDDAQLLEVRDFFTYIFSEMYA